MSFLGYKIDFSNLPLDIFVFYFVLSIIVWWLSFRYFKNKIANLNLENEDLKFELAVKESKKEEELTVLPTVNYIKKEFKVDNPLIQDCTFIDEEKSKLAVTTLYPDRSETLGEVRLTIMPAKVETFEQPPAEVNKAEPAFELLPMREVINFSKTHGHVDEIKAGIKEVEKSVGIIKDDLKLVEGIGFKIQEILNKNGVFNFKQLSELEPITIKGFLEAAGTRFAMHDPSTWPKQAELAKDCEWPALRRLQDELDKGKVVK